MKARFAVYIFGTATVIGVYTSRIGINASKQFGLFMLIAWLTIAYSFLLAMSIENLT